MLRKPALAALLVGVALAVAALVPSAPTSAAQMEGVPGVDARIEVVWPHDSAGNEVPVTQADRANVTVYLFERGTRNAFCPEEPGGVAVTLAIASDNGVPLYVRLPSSGVRRQVVQAGKSFTVWDFNDVDVSLARDPSHRLYLTVRDFVSVPPPSNLVGGKVPRTIGVQSNVWAHAADALTFFPAQDLPSSTQPAPAPGALPQLDPRIEIVWPHDQQGRQTSTIGADLVNITVTVFHHGSLVSVSPDYDRPLQLYQALNQEPLRPVAVGQKRIVTADGLTYPVWDFNNVDVSLAKDPRNKYFFQVAVDSNWSNVWVHGADGRTFFPQQDVPERGCP